MLPFEYSNSTETSYVIAHPILHENLPVIEVTDPFILDDLYADPRTAQFLLTRIAPTLAVIAPAQTEALLTRLIKQGHTPKVLEA